MAHVRKHIANHRKSAQAFQSRAVSISINPSLDIINIIGILILGLLGLYLIILVG